MSSIKTITYKEAAARIGVTPSQISDYARKGYFAILHRVRMNVIYEASFNEFVTKYYRDVKALDNLRESLDTETAALKQQLADVQSERCLLGKRSWFFSDGKRVLEDILTAICSSLNPTSGGDSPVDPGLTDVECGILLDVCYDRSIRDISSFRGLSQQRICQKAWSAIRKLRRVADSIRAVVDENLSLTRRVACQHDNILLLRAQVLDQRRMIDELKRELDVKRERQNNPYSYAAERKRFAEQFKLSEVDSFSVRTLHCLKHNNINTISDLVRLSERDMLYRWRNFGKKSFSEIRDFLASCPGNYAFHLGMNLDAV